MKKILFLAAIMLAVGVFSSSIAQVKMLSGRWGASTITEGYTLDKNSGQRSITISINFSESFKNKPEVILGMIALDASSEDNIRYRAEAVSVTRDAMTIKISTWADTQIYGISGYWLAYGE